MNVRRQIDSKKRYVGFYTLLFLIVCAAVFFSFLRSGRSLVCKVDGESQYIVYLRYMGQYLREAVRNILHGHFQLRQYDFSIGMGDDIGAIVRFHPLDFLSVFVPTAYTEQVYAVILLLRFYLAGLAFSAYAFSAHDFVYADPGQVPARPAWQNVLSGSLVYTFCGFMLIRVTNHPTYAAPFIVLPLLLLGLERVAAGKGSLLFILSVFLGFWSNYYFMYISSIGLLFYACLRYPDLEQTHRVRRFFPYAGRLLGLYLVGLSMSMGTLLPEMIRYRTSFRLSQTSRMQSLWVYADKRRYFAWFLNLISPYQSSGNGLNLNFAVVALPALAILFTRTYRRRRALRATLLWELAALLVPVFGYVFAGMNNENNRWIYLLALSLGMTCAYVMDDLVHLQGEALRNVSVLAALFFAAVAGERALGMPNRFNEIGAAELAVFLCLIWLLRHRRVKTERARTALLLATALSVSVNGIITYAPVGGDRASAFQPAGHTTRAYEDLDRRVAAGIQDPTFYRVDAGDVEHGLENAAEYFGYNSIGMYNSILNKHLIRTLLEEGNAGLDAVTQVHDLDGRPVAESLAHVKYFIAGPDQAGKVPYGFRKKDQAEIYENENLLSAGFTSDRFISWEAYQDLTDLEKEWVKLEAVVLPEDCPYGTEELRAEGMEEVTAPSCAIAAQPLQTPDVGSGQASLAFTGDKGTYSFLRLRDLQGAGSAENLTVCSEGIRTRVRLRGETDVYTLGRTDYLINLGYNEETRERAVSLSFQGQGARTLGAAQLVSVSMDGFEQKIAALNEEALEGEEIRDGSLTGTIRNRKTKLAVFSIPAQVGWTLYVDGEKTPAQVLDGMYIGTLLAPGSHRIRLVYRTAGLTAGLVCSILGLLALVLVFHTERKRRRKYALRDRKRLYV